MKRIAVIDDDPHICKVMEVILGKEGYEIHVANSGEDGLELVRAVRPDMVICDVMMPGMDGYRFTEIIREEDRFSALPIIMLTAKKRDEDVMEGYKKGVDYYLTKPFTKDQLLYGLNLMLQGDELA